MLKMLHFSRWVHLDILMCFFQIFANFSRTQTHSSIHAEKHPKLQTAPPNIESEERFPHHFPIPKNERDTFVDPQKKRNMKKTTKQTFPIMQPILVHFIFHCVPFFSFSI